MTKIKLILSRVFVKMWFCLSPLTFLDTVLTDSSLGFAEKNTNRIKPDKTGVSENNVSQKYTTDASETALSV